MTVLRTTDGVRQDFISKDIPAGHDTLWGWAAKWTPDELPDTVDLARDFVFETRELQQKSMAGGYLVIEVDAPPALRVHGLDKVPAFDMQLLFLMSRG